MSEVLGTVVLHKNETLDHSFSCENGEDGTLDLAFLDGQLDAAFSDCVVRNALINGDVENANRGPLLSSVDVGRPGSDDLISFNAHDDRALLGINTTRSFKLSGVLDAEPDFGGFEVGPFLLVVNSLEISPTGVPLAGSITFDFDADTNITGISGAQIVYDGSNIAHVIVTLGDGSVRNYKFELKFRNFI